MTRNMSVKQRQNSTLSGGVNMVVKDFDDMTLEEQERVSNELLEEERRLEDEQRIFGF